MWIVAPASRSFKLPGFPSHVILASLAPDFFCHVISFSFALAASERRHVSTPEWAQTKTWVQSADDRSIASAVVGEYRRNSESSVVDVATLSLIVSIANAVGMPLTDFLERTIFEVVRRLKQNVNIDLACSQQSSN